MAERRIEQLDWSERLGEKGRTPRLLSGLVIRRLHGEIFVLVIHLLKAIQLPAAIQWSVETVVVN